MSTALITRTKPQSDDPTPCSFRGCLEHGGWIGTPICQHSQLFCTTHMLRLSRPGVLAHCIVCREVTPAPAVIWKEYRP